MPENIKFSPLIIFYWNNMPRHVVSQQIQTHKHPFATVAQSVIIWGNIEDNLKLKHLLYLVTHMRMFNPVVETCNLEQNVCFEG